MDCFVCEAQLDDPDAGSGSLCPKCARKERRYERSLLDAMTRAPQQCGAGWTENGARVQCPNTTTLGPFCACCTD